MTSANMSDWQQQQDGRLEEEVMIGPELFEKSKYGSPIVSPETLGNTAKSAAALAAETQRSKGSVLDDIFGIKR